MTVEKLEILITSNTNELRKEIKKTSTNILGLQKDAKKGTAGVADAFKKLKQGIVALGIGKIIKDSIQSGMDAIESDSLFETSLGKNADAVRAWSDEVSNALGLNAIAVRKNTGTIFNMTSSMGISEENALKMAKGISLLSEDMASFRNLKSEEAFNKLRSALTGEAEGLKALGILVDENTVKQVAYSEGIAKNGAELTQQQKVLARYVAILKQTGKDQGDLARTLTSPSNQLRILKNNLTQAGIALSAFFMPAVRTVLPWLNALAKVATQALNSLASFFGLTGGGGTADDTEDISKNVGGIGAGLDDATKKAKKMKASLSGIDEMNVLTDNSGSDSGDSSGGGTSVGLDFDLSEYDAHLDWIEGDANALADRIKTKFTETFGSIDFTNFFTALGELKEAVAPLVENVGTGLGWFVDNVLVPIAEWVVEDVVPAFLNLLGDAISFVNQIIEDLKPTFQWFWDNVLSPIAEWTGGVIVDVLNGFGDALEWITNNKVAMEIIEAVGLAIGVVATALGVYSIAMGVANVVTGVFSAIMAVLTSPITLVALAITALIAIVILCVKHWDEIKEVASTVWQKIKDVWASVSEWFKTKVVQPVANFFSGLWEGLKNGAKKVWDGIKSVFSSIGSFFSGIWEGIKNIFSKAGKFISDTIGGAFKGAINAVLGTAVKIINGFITAINFAIGIINKIPGVEITKLDKLEVPKFARGGIVDRPTLAMVGEAGKEAVMPLERNTGWIDQLASKLGEKLGGGGGGANLVVKIGEETIFDKFIEYTRDKSFETNGEVVFV